MKAPTTQVSIAFDSTTLVAYIEIRVDGRIVSGGVTNPFTGFAQFKEYLLTIIPLADVTLYSL